MLPGVSESSRQTVELCVNWAASSEPGEVEEAHGAPVRRGTGERAGDLQFAWVGLWGATCRSGDFSLHGASGRSCLFLYRAGPERAFRVSPGPSLRVEDGSTHVPHFRRAGCLQGTESPCAELPAGCVPVGSALLLV